MGGLWSFLSLEGLKPQSEWFSNRFDLFWIQAFVYAVSAAFSLLLPLFLIVQAVKAPRKALLGFLGVGLLSLFVGLQFALQLLNLWTPVYPYYLTISVFNLTLAFFAVIRFSKMLVDGMNLPAAVYLEREREQLVKDKTAIMTDLFRAQTQLTETMTKLLSAEDRLKNLDAEFKAETKSLRDDRDKYAAQVKTLQSELKASKENLLKAKTLSTDLEHQLEQKKAEFIQMLVQEKWDQTRLNDEKGTLAEKLESTEHALQEAKERLAKAAEVAQQLENRMTELQAMKAAIEAQEAALGEVKSITRVNVGEVLQEVVDHFRSDKSFGRPIEFEFALPEKPLEGNWHRDSLKKAVLSIVAYSIEKCSPTGAVIEVSARDMKERVEITISGTGAGVHPSSVLFVIFPRGKSGRVPSGYNLDNNLVVAKILIEQFHGVMWLESELGVGTIFHIELPTHAGSVESPKAQAS